MTFFEVVTFSAPFRALRFLVPGASAMPGDTNYIHEQEIWKQRLKNETEGAAHWYDNWGFLAGREPPEPRGFSTKVAKYAYGGGQWSVKSVRVPDNTAEGLAAATSEQNARTFLSSLTYETNVPNEMKPCKDKVCPFLTNQVGVTCASTTASRVAFPCRDAVDRLRLSCPQGITLVASETSGPINREAALLLRAHKFQSLGDACRTEGVDPNVKYNTPIFMSHDYGWRVSSTNNHRKSLEMFGVSQYGIKEKVSKFY